MSVLPMFVATSCERGAALIGLAVSLPLVLLVFVITIDFARVFYLAIDPLAEECETQSVTTCACCVPRSPPGAPRPDAN
jgi:hypothetical protein